MTKEDVIKMAREAGLLPSDSTFGYGAEVAELSRFAALVAASEREACAKLCADGIKAHHYPMLSEVAAAIRARSNHAQG
jgi:hypothetical protein